MKKKKTYWANFTVFKHPDKRAPIFNALYSCEDEARKNAGKDEQTIPIEVEE